jgi:hypothetical protein
MVSVILLMNGCAEAPVVEPGGGGASETVATVTSGIGELSVHIESDTVFSAVIHILDAEYSYVNNTYFRDSTTLSNETPDWSLSGLMKEAYHVFVTDDVSGTTAFFTVEMSSLDTGNTKDKRLSESGSISGVVRIESTGGELQPVSDCSVFIVGSPYLTRTDSEGRYDLSGIPEGTYTIDAKRDVNRSYWGVKGPGVEITGDTLVVQDIVLQEM